MTLPAIERHLLDRDALVVLGALPGVGNQLGDGVSLYERVGLSKLAGTECEPTVVGRGRGGCEARRVRQSHGIKECVDAFGRGGHAAARRCAFGVADRAPGWE